MGVDYMVHVIEKRDDLPEAIKQYVKNVNECTTITLNGKEYYLTFDVNNEAETEETEQAWEVMPEGSYGGAYFD